jgi:hypothetical protein
MLCNSSSDGPSLTTAMPTISEEDIKSFIIGLKLLSSASFIVSVCVCVNSRLMSQIFL